MNGGETRFNQTIAAMLEELFYQAELSQTPHHFIYRFRNDRQGIAKLLDRSEQLEMLQVLDTRALIELGVDHFGDNDSLRYTIGFTDAGWRKYDDYRKTNGNIKQSSHSAQLILEDVYLKILLDNSEQITVRRFHDSDAYKLFTQLFNKPIGYSLRINDIFPNYGSLTKIVKDTKLEYLLPVFFADLGSKELRLLNMPVEIDDETYRMLLSKSK